MVKIRNLLNPIYLYQRREKFLDKFQEIISIPRANLAVSGLPITLEDKKLFSLKNIHQGKIGFLIGNGPSVRVEDLEKLKGQVSFCCNRFYLAYEMMEFRPAYTLASDLQTIEDFGEEIVNQSEGQVFLAWKTRPHISGDFIWIRSKHILGFSENLFKYVIPGGGTLIVAIQLGYFMGINRFVLYGVDHNYNYVEDKDSQDVWHSAKGEGNHFIKNYRSGKPWCPPQTQIIEQSFQTCDQVMRAQGGWIKNATRGGKLEVLERLDFDWVLQNLLD